MMKSISFKLKDSVSVSAALARFNNLNGIGPIKRTFPDAEDPTFVLFYLVEVELRYADEVLSVIKSDPSVEIAHFPAERSQQ